MFSSNAATDDAWQSLVQWSTLLVLKAVLISFWNIYASSLLPLADPKPAREFGPNVFFNSLSFLPTWFSASSHEASLKFETM